MSKRGMNVCFTLMSNKKVWFKQHIGFSRTNYLAKLPGVFFDKDRKDLMVQTNFMKYFGPYDPVELE